MFVKYKVNIKCENVDPEVDINTDGRINILISTLIHLFSFLEL